MVWDFQTMLNNQQGLSRTQVTLRQVLCLHYNREVFQELTQVWLRGHLVSQATPAALCSMCFWKNEMKDFYPPGEPDAPGQLPGRHPQPRPALRGTSRDRHKHRKKKTLSTSLPKKGYFRGIVPKQGKLSSWVTSVSFFLQNQTSDLPHNL